MRRGNANLGCGRSMSGGRGAARRRPPHSFVFRKKGDQIQGFNQRVVETACGGWCELLRWWVAY
ncbi:MAG: hypothetical protein ACKESB_01945 [Candidatus Hodgkinia cicadicola]